MTGKTKKWLALCAGAPMLASAAAPRDVPVYPMPDTVMPNIGIALRTEMVLKPGDEIMRASVAQTQKATVEGTVKVAIDRFSDELTPGEELTAVITPESTAAEIGGKGPYFCGRDQRSRSSFGEAMIGDWFSKFKSIVRFCFFDSDRDGALDHVFLAGAKDPLLKKAIPIAPTAYKRQFFVKRDAGEYLRLRYRKYVPEKQRVQLEMEVYHDGKKSGFDYILNDGTGKTGLDKLYPLMETNPKKIPYPVFFNDVLGAEIEVRKVDAAGNATIVINRNFKHQLFRPVSIQVTTIYIYI